MLKINLANYLVFLCLLSFALAGCSSDREVEAEVDVLKKQVSEMKGQIEVFRVAVGEMSVSTEKLSKSNKNLFYLQQQMLEMDKGLRSDDIKKREIEKEKADLSKRKTELLKTRMAEIAARMNAVVIGSLSQGEIGSLRIIVTRVEEGAELNIGEIKFLEAMFDGNITIQNYIVSQSAKKEEVRNTGKIIRLFVRKRNRENG